MGMFDWYHPSQELKCPVCDKPLREWQGKDGPNALYVWTQGRAEPIEQVMDDECKGPSEIMQTSRLPENFLIYSHDCERHRVSAACKVHNHVWTETRVVEVFDYETGQTIPFR
jgi:hypothetical protein